MPEIIEDVIIPEVKAKPASVETKCVGFRCSFCPAENRSETYASCYDPGLDWEKGSSYHEDKIAIYRKKGSNYPESDFYGTVEVFDCCLSCWESKVVPALKEINGELRKMGP